MGLARDWLSLAQVSQSHVNFIDIDNNIRIQIKTLIANVRVIFCVIG